MHQGQCYLALTAILVQVKNGWLPTKNSRKSSLSSKMVLMFIPK
jgi:hypothetical protein